MEVVASFSIILRRALVALVAPFNVLLAGLHIPLFAPAPTPAPADFFLTNLGLVFPDCAVESKLNLSPFSRFLLDDEVDDDYNSCLAFAFVFLDFEPVETALRDSVIVLGLVDGWSARVNVFLRFLCVRGERVPR